MYKTIRQGENSLQYTILPQHDDFKSVDGKLRPARISGGGGGGGRKKKNVMAFIGLFFVCSIITGAVLVPLIMSVEFMASPSAWFYKSTNVSTVATTTTSKANKSSTSSDSNTVPTVVTIKNNGVIKNNDVFIQHPTNFQKLKTFRKIIKFDYPPTVNVETTTVPTKAILTTTIEPIITTDQQEVQHKQAYPQVNRQIYTATTTTDISLVNKETTINIDHIQNNYLNTIDDDVDGEDNLLLRPPPPQLSQKQQLPENITNTEYSLVAATTILTTTEAAVKLTMSPQKEEKLTPIETVGSSKESKNWITSHWPIVDPSTYFQWTVRIFARNYLFFI